MTTQVSGSVTWECPILFNDTNIITQTKKHETHSLEDQNSMKMIVVLTLFLMMATGLLYEGGGGGGL